MVQDSKMTDDRLLWSELALPFEWYLGCIFFGRSKILDWPAALTYLHAICIYIYS